MIGKAKALVQSRRYVAVLIEGSQVEIGVPVSCYIAIVTCPGVYRINVRRTPPADTTECS